MRSLWGSGLRHVLAGESTLEELLRVTDVPREEEPAEPPPAPRRGLSGRTEAAAPPLSSSASPLSDFSMDMELLEEPSDVDGTVAGGRGQGACVLLVEDEEQLRRVMKDLLQREGYRVAEARDGVQALDEVDRFAPDVIILDLNLPGLDGYGVLAQLRSRPATRDIPVMVLTAKGDEDNEVRVFELGADDFVTKPFRARALTARLEAMLARRRA
jgi:CheY-like chemotaxis protein